MRGASETESGKDAEGWSTPSFDTMANLRALSAIQRRGLEAANQVIARLVERADQSPPVFGAAPKGSNGPAAGTPIEQWLEWWATTTQSLLAASGGAGPIAPGPGSAGPGVTVDPLQLEPVAPGDQATGELWIHNRSGAAFTDVRLHCGDLRSHEGHALSAAGVCFDPSVIPELADRSSRGITVSIVTAPDTPPGRYRGTVLAANVDSVWLPLELVVDQP